MSELGAIGFPAPLLGDTTLRLPVFFTGGGLLVLGKPPGISIDVHPMEPNLPAIIPALVKQIAEDKAELKPYELQSPFAIYHLDSAMSGAAMIACEKETAAHFRNAFGSQEMLFTFHFVAKGEPSNGNNFVCQLPLARHSKQNDRMIVSHKTGKQCQTTFQRLEQWGEWSLWSAETHYPRLHQIRLHACENGLKISGETLYDTVPFIYLSDLKRRYTTFVDEPPLYPHLALHLNRVTVEGLTIETPYSRKLSVLLSRLRVTL